MAGSWKSHRKVPSDLAKNRNRELVQPRNPGHVQTKQFVRFSAHFETEISSPLRPSFPAREYHERVTVNALSMPDKSEAINKL